MRAAGFVRLLVRSRAPEEDRSRIESGVCGTPSPLIRVSCRLQSKNAEVVTVVQKMTDFPSAVSCNDDESGQQTALLRRGELHKFQSDPLLRWSAAKKVWGWAAVSRITSHPCRRDGTPALAVPCPGQPASRPLVSQKRQPLLRLGRRQLVTRTGLSHQAQRLDLFAKKPRIALETRWKIDTRGKEQGRSLQRTRFLTQRGPTI